MAFESCPRCHLAMRAAIDRARGAEATVERLESQATNHQAEINRLRKELDNADAIRAALVEKIATLTEIKNSVPGVAADMLRALELVEAAFYAGVDWLQSTDPARPYTAANAFRQWSTTALASPRTSHPKEKA